MNEAEARLRLERMVDASSDPTLGIDEVTDLVAKAKRPDPTGNLPTNVATSAVWAASTIYVYGDVRTASPAAARWWRCVQAGTSGTTQPSWPTLTGSPCGTQILDGSVIWEDAGGPWSPTWDLHAAAAEGWEQKAGKVAGRYQFGTDGQMFFRQQMIDHCERKARQHRRRVAVSAPMQL